MKKRIKDIFKLAIFLSLGIFIVWYLLKDPQQRALILKNTKEVMLGYRWVYLVICMFIGFLSVVLRGLRSVLMIEPLGYKISKINSYHAVMIGYFANFLFPRLGEVLRCSVLQKQEKVPFQKSFGTVITERVIDMLLFGVLFLIALVLESEKLLPYIKENVSFSGTGKYILLGGMVGITVLVYVFRKKINSLSIYQKAVKIGKEFWAGLISIKDLKKPFRFVLYSLLIWVCYYFMFYIATFAFPDLAVLGTKGVLLASLSCLVIGTIGFATPIPGGIGVYSFLVYKALSLYEIPEGLGMTVGFDIWAAETLMYLALGLTSVLMLLYKKEKTKA